MQLVSPIKQLAYVMQARNAQRNSSHPRQTTGQNRAKLMETL